jgi:hypothetical protein
MYISRPVGTGLPRFPHRFPRRLREASARRWRASRRRSCSWRREAGRRCSRRNDWSCCREAVGLENMRKTMGKTWRAVDFYRDFPIWCDIIDDNWWSLTMVYECLWHDILWYLMKWLVYPCGKSQGAKHEKRCRCSLIFQSDVFFNG